MNRKKFAPIFFRRLEKEYGSQKCFLNFGSPWELLVAVMLSAQCTDERVNRVTPALFERFADVREYAKATQREMEKLVHSTGFYRNKARHIRESAKMIVKKFGGEVPGTMSELLQLPGVARKTANVILSVAFGLNVGVVVDTHVGRISRRLGLTSEMSPEKIEQDLIPLLPRKNWHEYSLLLISHGRAVCTARKAFCGKCVLKKVCPSAGRV
ncbi:MAG: endonuclease III [Patescibacteria group bacterium]